MRGQAAHDRNVVGVRVGGSREGRGEGLSAGILHGRLIDVVRSDDLDREGIKIGHRIREVVADRVRRGIESADGDEGVVRGVGVGGDDLGRSHDALDADLRIQSDLEVVAGLNLTIGVIEGVTRNDADVLVRGAVELPDARARIRAGRLQLMRHRRRGEAADVLAERTGDSFDCDGGGGLALDGAGGFGSRSQGRQEQSGADKTGAEPRPESRASSAGDHEDSPVSPPGLESTTEPAGSEIRW